MEQVLSPWKIRVTVEAEPEEKIFGRGRSISKTTVVPLRETSPVTSPCRRRGSRKGASRKAGSKRRTTGSLDQENTRIKKDEGRRLIDLDTDFLEDGGETEKEIKRKSLARKPRKVLGPVEGGGSANPNHVPSNSPPSEMMTEDSQPLLSAHEDDAVIQGERPPETVSPRGESPEVRELDLNFVSLRNNGGPPRPILKSEVASRDEMKPPVPAYCASDSFDVIDGRRRQVSTTSARSYPTPDASVDDEMEACGATGDPTDEHAGFDTILESEGFTMIDLDSIPSAQHFVASPINSENQPSQLPALKQSPIDLSRRRPASDPVPAHVCSIDGRCSPAEVARPVKPPTKGIVPPYLTPPEGDESDISSTVPSSPPVDLAQRKSPNSLAPLAQSALLLAHTPPAPTGSPKPPSLPNRSEKAEQIISSESIKTSPPKIARVVRAGVALQGLLSPETRSSLVGQPAKHTAEDLGKHGDSTPKEKLDDLFLGFDSGTRRELRAGLRFGEELAKREKVSSSMSSTSGQGSALLKDRHTRPGANPLYKGETLVGNRPGRSEGMQRAELQSLTVPNREASPSSSPADESAMSFDPEQTCGSIRYLDVEARERRWQLEREAISRQIENANSSQVIVIDSDDEEDSGEEQSGRNATARDDEDIWLAQAEEEHSSSRCAGEDLFPPAEQLRQRESAVEAVCKPRRKLIPSPWKTGESIDGTFMTDGDLSGMFWNRQPKNQPQAKSFSNAGSRVAKRSLDTKNLRLGSSVQEERRPAAAEGLSSQGGEENISDDEKHWYSEHDIAEERILESKTDEDSWEESLTQPEPIRIPVNFNDTTDISSQSEDEEYGNGQLESPPSSPCRASTPRSSMKGSRPSSQSEMESTSPTPRKVAFSQTSQCLDESGVETTMQVRGGTLSPAPSTAATSRHDSEQNSLGPNPRRQGSGRSPIGMVETGSVAAPPQEAAAAAAAASSWLGRLTGWGLKSSSTASQCPAEQKGLRQQAGQGVTTMPLDLVQPTTPALSNPSADVADNRIPPPPTSLPASGYFSDAHYKHLHIFYLKSLKPTFTRPGSIRPQLAKYIGQKIYSGDGEFAWEMTRRDAEVVERWIRSFEGRDAREDEPVQGREQEQEQDPDSGKETSNSSPRRTVGWDELDLCKRLFSIIAGQELRRDRRDR